MAARSWVRVFVLVLVASRAMPQGRPPPTPEQRAELEQAARLSAQVVTLFRAGRSREALPLAEQAYEIRDRILGPDHPDTAAALVEVASMLAEAGALEKSIEMNLRGLAQLEKAYGADDPRLTTAITNLAVAYRSLGRHEETLPLAERALRIQEKAHGHDSPAIVLALQNLGIVLAEAQRFDESAGLLRRALAIQERALGPRHPAVAQAHQMLGTALRRKGDLEEAGHELERAVELLEAAVGRNHVALTDPLSELAGIYSDTHRLTAALDTGRRITGLLVAAGQDASEAGATAYLNVGRALFGLGRYEEAAGEFRQALHCANRAPRIAPEARARCLHRLGDVLAELEQYDEAMRTYEEAAALLEQAFGPDHFELAANLNNRGLVLLELGRRDEALALLERARKILAATLGPEHREVGVCTNNIASTLSLIGRIDEALENMKRAVAILRKAEGPDDPRTLLEEANLAALELKKGDIPTATRHLETTLAACERKLGKEHPALAGPLQTLARARIAAGRRDDAVALARRGLAIQKAAYGDQRDEYAQGLGHLSGMLSLAGQRAEAGEAAREALAIAERNLRSHFAGLDGAQRIRLVNGVRGILVRWLAEAPFAKQTGYDEVLRFKGIAARAIAAERRLAREAGGGAAARVEELRAAERRLASLANSMPFGGKQRGAWQERYAKAAAERERLGVALARDFAPLRAGLERMDIGLPRIRAALRPGEALVDYVVAGDQYLAFVVRAEGDVARVSLGDAGPLEAAARDFAERAADRGTAIDDADWLAAGRRLHDLVVAPLRAALGDAKALCVCPDAALASVPFAALPLPGSPERFLIDDYELSSVAMAQDLVSQADDGSTGAGALLVGGVTYDRAGAVAPGERREEPPVVSSRAPRGRTFTALPGTLAEIEYLAGRLGRDALALSADDATEARLRATVRGRRIVHVATHGFVRDDLMAGLRERRTAAEWLGANMERSLAAGYDPMLLAGLAMAGASVGDGGDGDDGVLTAAEASHLDLRGVELVVLSACETALGRAEAGEGVIGLVQGFQMAGTRSVIASLWQVDDDATRLLMERMYEGLLDGRDRLQPAAALRRAALSVRAAKDKAGRVLSGPSVWAAFVAYGR